MTLTMTSPPLLDLLIAPAADPASTDAPLLERAERLIDFALAEHERIAGLDVSMDRIALNHADPQGANAMRRMYQQWADQSDALLRRVKSHGLQSRLQPKFDALERAIGVTLAMLSITLDSIRRGEDDVRNGRTHSLEEVRRELRAAAGR